MTSFTVNPENPALISWARHLGQARPPACRVCAQRRPGVWGDTAFDIAGNGKASTVSLIRAIEFAARLSEHS